MPLTPTVAETLNTSQGVNKSESSQKKRGRKLVRRDRAKAYRDINKLKAENEKLRKKCNKYKKRWQRARSGVSSQQDLTPKTTVKKLLRGRNIGKDIRRKLLFSEVISKELSENYKKLKTSEKEKQIFTKAISGKIIKKYRLAKEVKMFLSRSIVKSNSKRCKKEIEWST